jgi:hypothetical protein
MLKDIHQPEVKDIGVAIIQEPGEDNALVWNVYLLNWGNEKIYGVLVTSRGYGVINDETRESSVLRHFFEELPAGGFIKIEPVIEDVFELTNEYWVSYYLNGKIFDKKFIFPAASIRYENFKQIPVLGNKGVMAE